MHHLKKLKISPVVITGIAVGLASFASNARAAGAQGKPSAAGDLASTRQPAAILVDLTTPAIAISPDGTRIVLVLRSGASQQLYLRSVQQTEPTPIPGTEGALTPVFSPDGKWIAFFADGKLKKVAVDGGTVATLCDVAAQPRGVSWNSDDTIVFTPGLNFGLVQVSSSGGTPKPITERQEERSQRWPELMPASQAVLFTIAKGGSWDDGQIVAQKLDTGERRVIVDGGTAPRYLPTGHLAYVHGGALMVVPFDPVRLETTGTATPLVQGILMEARDGAAQFSISRNGTLAYIPTEIGSSERKLVWVNRDGSATPLPAPLRAYEHPRLSPDGRQVVASIAGDAPNVFVYDISANRLRQVTSQANNALPLWAPDGKRVVFRSTKAGDWNVFWKNADGSGDAEQLTASPYLTEPSSWSPDGQLLAFVRTDPKTRRDVWVLPMKGERTPRPVLRTPADESAPRFSPDGRWIAYVCDESGRSEIYVQPFPTTGEKWQISTAGGREPVWAPNGGELFYRDEKKLMVAEIKTRPSFAASKPRLLFEGPYQGAISSRANYDISPDGRRFLMVEAGAQREEAAEIKIVPNWFEQVSRRVPSSGGP